MDANKFAAALGKEAKMPITAGRLKSTRPGMPVMSTSAAKAPVSSVLPTGAGGFGAAKPAMPNIRQVTAPESGSTPVRATTSANDSVASAGPVKQSAVPGIATAAGAGMPKPQPSALRGNLGDIFQGPTGRGLLPPSPATAKPGVPKVPMAPKATYKMGGVLDELTAKYNGPMSSPPPSVAPVRPEADRAAKMIMMQIGAGKPITADPTPGAQTMPGMPSFGTNPAPRPAGTISPSVNRMKLGAAPISTLPPAPTPKMTPPAGPTPPANPFAPQGGPVQPSIPSPQPPQPAAPQAPAGGISPPPPAPELMQPVHPTNQHSLQGLFDRDQQAAQAAAAPRQAYNAAIGTPTPESRARLQAARAPKPYMPQGVPGPNPFLPSPPPAATGGLAKQGMDPMPISPGVHTPTAPQPQPVPMPFKPSATAGNVPMPKIEAPVVPPTPSTSVAAGPVNTNSPGMLDSVPGNEGWMSRIGALGSHLGGAAVPGAIGAGIGGLYGALFPGEDEEGEQNSRLGSGLTGAAMGGAVGAGLGATGIPQRAMGDLMPKMAEDKAALLSWGGGQYHLGPNAKKWGVGVEAGYSNLAGLIPIPHVGVRVGTPYGGLGVSGPLPSIGIDNGNVANNRWQRNLPRGLPEYLYDRANDQDVYDVPGRGSMILPDNVGQEIEALTAKLQAGKKPAVKKPAAKETAPEKTAMIGTALLGGGVGAAIAPKGHRLEGAGRGMVNAAGMDIGAATGMLAGGGLMGIGGAGLGGLLATLANRYAGTNIDPGVAASALGTGGAIAGGVLGGGAGGYGGYRLAQKMLGPSSYDPARKKSTKPDAEAEKKPVDKAAAFAQKLGTTLNPMFEGDEKRPEMRLQRSQIKPWREDGNAAFDGIAKRFEYKKQKKAAAPIALDANAGGNPAAPTLSNMHALTAAPISGLAAGAASLMRPTPVSLPSPTGGRFHDTYSPGQRMVNKAIRDPVGAMVGGAQAVGSAIGNPGRLMQELGRDLPGGSGRPMPAVSATGGGGYGAPSN